MIQRVSSLSINSNGFLISIRMRNKHAMIKPLKGLMHAPSGMGIILFRKGLQKKLTIFMSVRVLIFCESRDAIKK